ncbi:MAG: GIY-YIG nuclease family protein, partial [Bacteroidota bacterium]
MEHFFVYILYSQKHSRSYVGQTNNIDARLERHNKGEVISTKPYRPWVRIYYEAYETRGEAVKQERWYKTGIGHARVKELIAIYLKEKAAIAS